MLEVLVALGQLLLLLLHLLHDLLRLGVLGDHDQRHSDVGQHDGLHAQVVVHLLLVERLLHVDSLLVTRDAGVVDLLGQ